MINITFIGNCQTVSLCFYFQKLLLHKNFYVSWISYGDKFTKHLSKWSDKCINKIINYDDGIKQIKKSDIIIYQQIGLHKSTFCNTETLRSLNNNCKLILIPSIYVNYNDFENSIKELINRETKNNVDIKVSNILLKFKNKNLMLTQNHPKTFLFMELVKLLCEIVNIDFFTKEQYYHFIRNENYMGLP